MQTLQFILGMYLQLGYLLAIPRLDYMQTEEDFDMSGLEFVVSKWGNPKTPI